MNVGDRVKFVQKFDGRKVTQVGEITKRVAANGKCQEVFVIQFDGEEGVVTLHASAVTPA